MNPFALLVLCVAGWMNRNQQDVIEYLQEEVRVLKELLGKKPWFNDGQRRQLAVVSKYSNHVKLQRFFEMKNGSYRCWQGGQIMASMVG